MIKTSAPHVVLVAIMTVTKFTTVIVNITPFYFTVVTVLSHAILYLNVRILSKFTLLSCLPLSSRERYSLVIINYQGQL